MLLRTNLVELVERLLAGDQVTWSIVVAFVLIVLSVACYERLTRSKVLRGKKERRVARQKRKVVLWEYERKD
jgi:hypothetical protein